MHKPAPPGAKPETLCEVFPPAGPGIDHTTAGVRSPSISLSFSLLKPIKYSKVFSARIRHYYMARIGMPSGGWEIETTKNNECIKDNICNIKGGRGVQAERKNTTQKGNRKSQTRNETNSNEQQRKTQTQTRNETKSNEEGSEGKGKK